jgi:hypothetical protein
MTVESSTQETPFTWLEEIVGKSRHPPLRLATRLVLAMVVLLLAAACMDGVLVAALDARFWRTALASPLMAGYVTLFQPVLKRWRGAAIQAFRPLGPVEDGRFQRLLAQASIFERRNEKLATAAGVAAGLLAFQPWDRKGLAWTWSPIGQSTWLTLVGLLLTMLVYGFIGFFLYSVLSGTRLFAELQSGDRGINAFELESLQPIAQWSLGIALYFVGGITLSLLTERSLALRVEQLIGYAAVSLAPVIVFFLNMWTVHGAMMQAKDRELRVVRANLVAASEALRRLPAEGRREKESALFTSIASWEAHQKRVMELPSWPYTNEIKRNLALSSLLPAVVGLAQGALPELLRQLLPPDVLEVLQRLLPVAW